MFKKLISWLNGFGDKAEPISLTYLTALNEIGVKELPGRLNSPRILEYLQSCEYYELSDEVPWCSAFVNWCFKQHSVPRTNSTLARSWEKWGKKAKSPKRGDIVIFKSNKNKWAGHVGFFVKEDHDRIWLLGGNQRDEVCILPYLKKGSMLELSDIRTYMEV